MSLEEFCTFKIKKGGDSESNKEMIKNFNNRTVFVHDEHNEGYLLLGKLEFNENDEACYKLHTKNGNKILHYHDMLEIIIPFS